MPYFPTHDYSDDMARPGECSDCSDMHYPLACDCGGIRHAERDVDGEAALGIAAYTGVTPLHWRCSSCGKFGTDGPNGSIVTGQVTDTH